MERKPFMPRANATPEEVAKEEFLSRDEEWSLARRWRDERDYEARTRILSAYQRMAMAYAGKASRSGLPFDDLLQEANLGLMQALDKFDPERGYGFGTFSRYHIISRIQIYTLENVAPVRIFNTAITKTLLSKFSRLKKEIESETGEQLDEAGRDAICGQLGIDRDQLQRFEMAVMTPVPLDAGAGNSAEEVTRPVELADGGEGPEAETLSKMARKQVMDAINESVAELEERERRIVRARHMCEPPLTLDVLSNEFKISRERVRQIELRALAHIRRDLARKGIKGVDSVFGA